MLPTFIHYGADKFNFEAFQPPRNYLPTKPIGGLWCSPVGDEFYSWLEWCKDNEYPCIVNLALKFQLPNTARVLTVETDEDYDLLFANYGNVTLSFSPFKMIDWIKVAQDYDSVYVLISKNRSLYWKLYGWDCDTLWICNPQIMREVKCEKI